MAVPHDVVIIGGGHNGLVTAFYLARSGRRPLVLERRPVVGGAAITDEFHPGFKCSTLAHLSGPLRAGLADDMDLVRHGLQTLVAETRLFAPGADGRGLVLPGDPSRAAQAIASYSRTDAAKFVDFHETVGRISQVTARLLAMTPPDIDRPSGRDLLGLLGAGRRLRSLGKKDFYRLMRWFPMAVADFVAEWFETELLRAALAARGILGTFLGPWSAGSGAVLLLRAAADSHSLGTVAVPRGGMGALTGAMASAARAAGATIRTGAEVERIEIRDGRVARVVLAGGEAIEASCVVSNADPRRTLLDLVDPVHLDPGLLGKLRNYRCRGVAAKINLALDGLPRFTALGSSGDAAADGHGALAGRIHIGPEIDYLERAFDDAKYGGLSKNPCMEATIPSILDPSLAPPGKHVMSIYLQYAPYQLRSGDWNARREELGDLAVRTLAAYAPDLPGLVLDGQVITPLDLEQDYALTGGHASHGEEAIDQIFATRPVIGMGRYRAPIRGLYLCGAGTHPGGGVTGAPGANAAREILKDLR